MLFTEAKLAPISVQETGECLSFSSQFRDPWVLKVQGVNYSWGPESYEARGARVSGSHQGGERTGC